MRNHFLPRVCGAVLLTLLTFVFASGQEFRGSITGKVTDPNGAVVAGATATVTNTGTNAESTAITNAEGSYDFPVLLPGKYKLLVTKDGFKVVVHLPGVKRDDITVAARPGSLAFEIATRGKTYRREIPCDIPPHKFLLAFCPMFVLCSHPLSMRGAF